MSEHRKEVAALGRFCGDLAHEHSDLDAGFIVSPPRRPPPTPIPTPVPTMIPATPRPSFSPIAFTTKLHIAAPLRGLDLDVADTPYLWEQGFRGHAAPAPQTGIVFRYDDGKPHEFSMNDVAFALDIVTLDDNGFVRDVTTLQPHPASDPINEVADFFIPATQFIIALPAGEAVQDGLVPGSRMGDFSAYYRRMTRPI